MKTENIEITAGSVVELIGEHVKMKVSMTNTDLRQVVEKLLSLVGDDEKKAEVIKDFASLLNSLSCSLDIVVPFPAGESYDLRVGRTTTFDGQKYYGGQVNISE